MTQYNSIERKITLHNENDETIELTINEKEVELYFPGFETLPSKGMTFTHDEFDAIIAEVGDFRAAAKLFKTLEG